MILFSQIWKRSLLIIALTTVVLICFTANERATAELKNYTYEKILPLSANANVFYILPKHQYFPDRKDDAMQLATCEAKDFNELSCNVTLEQASWNNSCASVSLYPKDRNREIIDKYDVELVPFGDDRVMLLWREISIEADNETFTIFMGVNILNMAKCKSVRLAFKINKTQNYFYDYPLALHEDTVDFFIDYSDFCADFSKQYNGKPPMCRVTYNHKGKRDGHARFFWPTMYDIGFIHSVSQSPDYQATESFFSSGVDVNNSELVVSHLSLDGSATELMAAKLNQSDEIQVMLGQSNGYGKYGICWLSQVDWRIVPCMQFDASGNVNINVSLVAPEVVGWVDARNLVDGGMLVIAGNCFNVTENDELECRSFWVWKIYRGGSHSEPIKFDGLGLRSYSAEEGFDMNIIESTKKDKYCFLFNSRCLVNEDWKLQVTCICITRSGVFT